MNQPITEYHHVPELAALDRCEHGRHRADPCFSCPGGQSSGNLFLPAGTRIGTTLYGEAIVVPPHEPGRSFSEVRRWTEDGHRIS